MNIELLDRLKQTGEEKIKAPRSFWSYPLFTKRSTIQKDAYNYGIKTMIKEIEDLKALILVQKAMEENTLLSDADKEAIRSATTLRGMRFYLHDSMYRNCPVFRYFQWLPGTNYFNDQDEDGHGPMSLNEFLNRYSKDIKFIKTV